MAFHRPLHPPRSQIRRREEVICCGRLMRCDASPPVLVSVRLYHLCSLVPSPVFARIRSYLRLCSLVFTYICTFSHPSSSAFSFSSVLVSQSRHLFLSLSPVICLVSQSRHLSRLLVCSRLPVLPALRLPTILSHPVRTQSAHSPHWAVHSDEIRDWAVEMDEFSPDFVQMGSQLPNFVRMNRTIANRIRASDRQRDLFSGKANV